MTIDKSGFVPESVVQAYWPKSDSDNVPTHAFQLQAATGTFFGVAMIVVALRFYERRRTRSFGMDDWFMLLAVPFTIGMMITQTGLVTSGGFGKHIWDVDPATYTKRRKLFLADEMCAMVAHTFTKFSILFFYRRLFSVSESRMRFLTNVGIAFYAAFLPGALALGLLQCGWTQHYWDPTKKCDKSFAITMLYMVVSCGGNLFLFCLPMKRLWETKLPTRQRVGLIAIFSIGFAACVISVVKAIFFVLYFTRPNWDSTWIGVPVLITCNIENSATIITASLPALKNLSGRAFRAGMSSVHKSKTGGTGRSYSTPAHTGASVSVKSGQSSDSVFKPDEYNMQSLKDGGEKGFEIVKTRTITVDVD